MAVRPHFFRAPLVFSSGSPKSGADSASCTGHTECESNCCEDDNYGPLLMKANCRDADTSLNAIEGFCDGSEADCVAKGKKWCDQNLKFPIFERMRAKNGVAGGDFWPAHAQKLEISKSDAPF